MDRTSFLQEGCNNNLGAEAAGVNVEFKQEEDRRSDRVRVEPFCDRIIGVRGGIA